MKGTEIIDLPKPILSYKISTNFIFTSKKIYSKVIKYLCYIINTCA